MPARWGMAPRTASYRPGPAARPRSTAQHDRHLLAAALDGDAPDPARLAGGALEVASLVDLLVVDRHDKIPTLETKALRRRAIGDVDDDDALCRRIDPQLV